MVNPYDYKFKILQIIEDQVDQQQQVKERVTYQQNSKEREKKKGQGVLKKTQKKR